MFSVSRASAAVVQHCVRASIALAMLAAFYFCNSSLARASGTNTTAGVCTVRVITSGLTDTADSGTTVDCIILWNSISTPNGAKTENLPVCSATSNASSQLTIADESLTAGSYPIVILPVNTSTISNTVNLTNAYSLIGNGQSVTMVCDGNSNWVVI